MNKELFIETLMNKLNYDKEKCTIINSILEENFIIGKDNKNKIINKLISKLNIDEQEADEIYTTSMDIISNEIVNKIKHPFKSKD